MESHFNIDNPATEKREKRIVVCDSHRGWTSTSPKMDFEVDRDSSMHAAKLSIVSNRSMKERTFLNPMLTKGRYICSRSHSAVRV